MKLSIIIPVYRVETTLNRCVESVVTQDFDDFELILVDDGSPDNCPQLCDSWAAKDCRISVIHKSNGGLSDARNAGIDAVSVDWGFRTHEFLLKSGAQIIFSEPSELLRYLLDDPMISAIL